MDHKDKIGFSEEMKTPNSLISEKSPYLLQHAYNPVDWHPWSEGAFQLAKEQDKPIFLSIGYSTCHWCHVMAHESFEDPEVAKRLNDAFVPVKVDLEERPMSCFPSRNRYGVTPSYGKYDRTGAKGQLENRTN